MIKQTILEVKFHDVHGVECTWGFYLTKRKDNTFSVSARCRPHKVPALLKKDLSYSVIRPKGIYRLKTPRQIWDAFSSLLGEAEEVVDYDVDEVLANIALVDPQLSESIKLIFDKNEVGVVELEALSFAKRYANQATWEYTGLGGIGYSIGMAIGRRAVGYYTEKYYRDHGMLPKGTHNVTVFFGLGGRGEVAPPAGINFEGKWSKLVTYTSEDIPTLQ